MVLTKRRKKNTKKIVTASHQMARNAICKAINMAVPFKAIPRLKKK